MSTHEIPEFKVNVAMADFRKLATQSWKEELSSIRRELIEGKMKRELQDISAPSDLFLLWEETESKEIKILIEVRIIEASKDSLGFSALIDFWRTTEKLEIKTIIIDLVSEMILKGINDPWLLLGLWSKTEDEEIRSFILGRISELVEVISDLLTRARNGELLPSSEEIQISTD